MNEPKDRISLRQKYERKIPREGTCGPTLVAFLLDKSVKEVIDNWRIPYRGYCSFRELEKEINKYGIKTDKVKPVAKDSYELPDEANKAIARIQWKKKYSNWKIPEKNTHFVYLEWAEGGLMLFDNEIGWFNLETKKAEEYLVRGKITNIIILR